MPHILLMYRGFSATPGLNTCFLVRTVPWKGLKLTQFGIFTYSCTHDSHPHQGPRLVSLYLSYFFNVLLL